MRIRKYLESDLCGIWMGQRLPTVQVRTQLVEQVHLFIRNNFSSRNLMIMLLCWWLGVTAWMFLLMTLINRILPFDETFGRNISPLARAALLLSSAYCPVLKSCSTYLVSSKTAKKYDPDKRYGLEKYYLILNLSQPYPSRRCSMLNC